MAVPVKTRSQQFGLFLPLSPDPERLEITFARIQGTVGEKRVGAPMLLDTHGDNGFQQTRFVLPEMQDKQAVREKQPTAVMRIYRPALPATVEFRAGKPAFLGCEGVRRQILAFACPWKRKSDWWSETAWAREEWDLEVRTLHPQVKGELGRTNEQETALHRVYKDLRTKRWIRGGNLRLKYVELHSASAFSFLEGASRPEDLISRAKELGLPAIALVDRDGGYGAPRLHMAAKSVGIRAHVGAEVSVEGFGNRASLPRWMPNSVSTRPVRLPLLVESRKGYQNLCRLITRYKLREQEKGTGTATLDEVGEHAEGLVCLTGGDEGVLAASLFNQGYDEASRNIETLTALFGRKNVYVELQRHCDPAEELRRSSYGREDGDPLLS